MENEVLPYLRQRFDLQGIIKSRVLRTCGIGESVLGAQIDDLMQLSNPTVGTRPTRGKPMCASPSRRRVRQRPIL